MILSPKTIRFVLGAALLLALTSCQLFEKRPNQKNGLTLASSLNFSSVTAGGCTPIAFESRNASGATVPAELDTEIEVSGMDSLSLFSDAQCTQSVDSVILPAGSTRLVLYFVPTQSGNYSLEMDDGPGGYEATKLSMEILAGAATEIRIKGASGIVRGTCSDAYRVETTDDYGNASVSGEAISLGLGGMGQGSFFSDAECQTPVSTLEIASDKASASFYFKNSTLELVLLTASPSLARFGDGSIAVLSYFSPPSRLAISAEDLRVQVSQCSRKLTLKVLDPGGARVALNPASSFDLQSSVTASFFSDAACTIPSPQITVSAGTDSKAFYLKSGTLGDLTLTVSDPHRKLATATARMSVLTAVPGAVDTSFGTNGLTAISFGTGASKLAAVTVGGDGKIYAAGTYENEGASSLALTRLNSNGAIDTSFGTMGKVLTSASADPTNQALGLVVQADGKIILTGSVGSGSSQEVLLARYENNGSLDASFGNNGIAIMDGGGRQEVSRAVILQPDGKILIAGSTQGETDFLVARFNSDGSLDSGFANSGRAEININSDDSAYALTLQPDGKIVVAGRAWSDDVGVARLNSDGSLDSGFLNSGTGALNQGDYEYATAVTVTSTGLIYLTGFTVDSSWDDPENSDLLAIRLKSDGSYDRDYNLDGRTEFTRVSRTNSVLSNERSYAHLLQADGRLVLAGQAVVNGSLMADLVRLDPNGQPDVPLFGEVGANTVALGGSSALINAMAQFTNNRAVIGATRDNQEFVISVVHL